MNCDIKTVITILYKQLVSSSVSTYPELVNTLFKSYFDDPANPEYDRSETSKLNAGTRTLSSKLTDFYVRKDKSVLLGDIKGMLKYILDKPQLHVSFFDLIINDPLISKPYKKQFGLSNSREYSDDEHLAEVFYSALTIAAYRPYYKDGKDYYADFYYDNTTQADALFSNSKLKPPCKYFCGREAELEELYTLVQTEGRVFLTGVAGVGKSELVRKYAQEYKSEYAHIGYYYYSEENGLMHLICYILPDTALVRSDMEEVFQENLDLLSSLGKSTLLIIDSFNLPIDGDPNMEHLLELECDVIVISQSNYGDDYAVYDLTEFRTFRESYALIAQFYPFDIEDRETKIKMHQLVSINEKYPFSLELCARSMKRGTDTPDTCTDALIGGIKNMKARIPANKDGKPRTDTHYNHIKRLFENADLNDEDKHVLSYMRFMPESGVSKLLFKKLSNLMYFTATEKMIDLGLIHENSDGTISLPSIVKKLVEADIKINPQDLYIFAEILFDTTPKEAPKEVLSEIAENLANNPYIDMIDQDIYVARHLFFQYFALLEDRFRMDMMLMQLAMLYNKNIFKHRLLYSADKAHFLSIIEGDECFDIIKQTIENAETNPRWHAHEDGKEPPSEPLVRSFIVSEEDDAEIFGLNDE